jgi:hypothetical protein
MFDLEPLPSGFGGTDTGVLDFCGGFLVVAMTLPLGLK